MKPITAFAWGAVTPKPDLKPPFPKRAEQKGLSRLQDLVSGECPFAVPSPAPTQTTESTVFCGVLITACGEVFKNNVSRETSIYCFHQWIP
ncbi:unnamed protein product [Arctogadus glacialis]